MFKKFLILFIYSLLAFAVCVQAETFFLSFYVLFPILFFPIIYFFEQWRNRGLLIVLIECFFVFFLYWFRNLTWEMSLFGFGICALSAGFYFYRRHWRQQLFDVQQLDVKEKDELEQFQQKHTARLESLHHLEKQVASLMDLFEIARDFSEGLSFESLADLIYREVLPELPFKNFQIDILHERMSSVDGWKLQRLIIVSDQGVSDKYFGTWDIPADILQQILETKSMVTASNIWFFPLWSGQELRSVVRVEGADPSDLAKFEVLVAHLVLQLKKIQLYDSVKELSIRDSLTGVYVRRHFVERLENELKRVLKLKRSLGLLMLDIDHFKRYNDDFGHLIGDATLKEVARVLCSSLRNVDIIARYGGEEFVVVLPEADLTRALEVAERIRSSVARHRFQAYGSPTRVTVSIGISIFPQDIQSEIPENPDFSSLSFELIRQTDKALYRAKEEGRNRVVCFRDLGKTDV